MLAAIGSIERARNVGVMVVAGPNGPRLVGGTETARRRRRPHLRRHRLMITAIMTAKSTSPITRQVIVAQDLAAGTDHLARGVACGFPAGGHDVLPAPLREAVGAATANLKSTIIAWVADGGDDVPWRAAANAWLRAYAAACAWLREHGPWGRPSPQGPSEGQTPGRRALRARDGAPGSGRVQGGRRG